MYVKYYIGLTVNNNIFTLSLDSQLAEETRHKEIQTCGNMKWVSGWRYRVFHDFRA